MTFQIAVELEIKEVSKVAIETFHEPSVSSAMSSQNEGQPETTH